MSDRGDTPATEAAPAGPDSKAPITRYSYHVLMSLRDSPLVAKPADMPPLSSWFGDDPEAPLSKSILNGAITSRALANSLDKNVLLAPNKSIFSSPSYGKRPEDTASTNSTRTQPHSSSRYRHNDELRPREHVGSNSSSNISNNGRDLRSSRTQNHSSERGLSHRDKTDRRANHHMKQRSISPSHSTKRHHQDRNMEGIRNRREHGRERTTSKLGNGDAQRTADKLPEWMDYTPSKERKPVRQLDAIPPAPPPGFSNDLEAWKSDMKLRDQTLEAKQQLQLQQQQQQPPSQVDEQPKNDTSDFDLLLGGMSSVDLHKPQSSGMEFLSATMLESPSLMGRRERGSRFAKFFAKRGEETNMPMEQPIPPQGKSISVNDLFGGPVAKPHTDMNMSYSQGAKQQLHAAPRMLSEEEVLQSLGAKRSPPPPQQQPQMPSAENAMGFDKVLQILSQPKPAAPNESKNDMIVQEEALSSPKPEPQQPSPPTSIPEERSPVRAPAEKQHVRTESTDSKPKLVGKAFAGNLPTSVLRQMSARSSEGRSPSIASTKSASRSFVAGSNSSAGGSPALSNHSPAAVKSGIPLQQQANSPGALPYASNAYHMPSPAYHLPHSSPVVEQVPRHQPRNLEQLLQYGDGLSPPMMARNGNGPMLPHPFQGQGAMEQFIPPHMMQPMPPHMGPVGPMLQPHHHLPPQLQGQVAHQFSPMQRDMMTPPTGNDHPYMGTVPPPHMMGNGGTGLPPHLFAKSQGWDRH